MEKHRAACSHARNQILESIRGLGIAPFRVLTYPGPSPYPRPSPSFVFSFLLPSPSLLPVFILVFLRPHPHILFFIPGHALQEKDLQRQKGVVTLVSSQEQRASAVLLMNWLSTAGQTLISFLHRFKWVFVCSGFRKGVQDSVSDSLAGLYPGRIDPTVSSYPAPRALAAPPCAAPIRPARSVSGFWIRQVFILLLLLHFLYINICVVYLSLSFSFPPPFSPDPSFSVLLHSLIFILIYSY